MSGLLLHDLSIRKSKTGHGALHLGTNPELKGLICFLLERLVYAEAELRLLSALSAGVQARIPVLLSSIPEGSTSR